MNQANNFINYINNTKQCNYIDHNIYVNNNIRKVDNYSRNANNKYRSCWFCDQVCQDFVAICENCKFSRIKVFSK